MRKLLQFFVLLCVFPLLFSGCGEAEPTTYENIRISNLKTPSDSLTLEEQAYMDVITDTLKTVRVIWTSDNSAQIVAQNTSEQALSLQINLLAFDKDGCMIDREWEELPQWDSGQETRISVFLSQNVQTCTIVGEYSSNGCWYMTDPIPVLMEKAETSEVSLLYAGNLPAVVRLEQSRSQPVSYTLLEYTLERDAYSSSFYDLTLVLRKESGEDNVGDNISFRIVDKNGAVLFTGNELLHLKPGETIRKTVSISVYKPGEHYLELR